MIIRRHDDDRARSYAAYSECGAYRYVLSREWGAGKSLLYVMLNPSTADEQRNDPTVERCERRARALGFGSMRVTNIFAFRATDPRLVKKSVEPVGPCNDDVLMEHAASADMILCAWGAHGAHQGRGKMVELMLRSNSYKLWHLGLTQAGKPRHPLYVGYAVRPAEWY